MILCHIHVVFDDHADFSGLCAVRPISMSACMCLPFQKHLHPPACTEESKKCLSSDVEALCDGSCDLHAHIYTVAHKHGHG